ncbi:putative cation-transporting ATPase 13A3, partial [Stegodyphus mimosarum]
MEEEHAVLLKVDHCKWVFCPRERVSTKQTLRWDREELVRMRKKGEEPKMIIEEEHLQLQGYMLSYSKLLLTCLAVMLSGGLLWILIGWNRRIYLKCTHKKCSVEKASKILLVDSHNQYFVEIVWRSSDNSLIYFYNKKIKYIWDPKQFRFVKVGGLKIKNCSEFYDYENGLSSNEASSLLAHHGKNSIDIEVKPIITLVLAQVRNPFYLYQAFIVTVWLLQFYYQFAICVVILSVISVSMTVWETRKQSRALRDAMRSHAIVTVIRDGKELQISSEDLVPGDVILIPKSHFTMVCDAVLLSGTCVMNESMLTGESIPVTKVQIENDIKAEYDSMTHKRSLLSCGTELMHSRDIDGTGVKALVYRTGFSTAKGELVRSILFPKPVKIQLDSDLLKCMGIFFILGIPPLIYAVIVGIRQEAYVRDTTLFVLNVITFFVPAGLPAVLTSINAHAQKRLRKQGIYCLNSRYISLCGSLDVTCFDKTGTLTEDSLGLHTLLPAENGKYALHLSTPFLNF